MKGIGKLEVLEQFAAADNVVYTALVVTFTDGKQKAISFAKPFDSDVLVAGLRCFAEEIDVVSSHP